MTPDEARGARLGLVRRLLAAFEGRDLPVPAFAARIGKDKKQVYRYERGEDKPKGETVDRIVEMCAAVGLAITPEWIERGRGGAAGLGELRVPDSALVPQATVVERLPLRQKDERARGELAAMARKRHPRKEAS